MQTHPRKPLFSSGQDARNVNVTSAIGIEETVGHQRARRNSLFSQTVIWVTGFICLAFLLGTLAQAWSNSQLMQKVQDAQHSLAQVRAHHNDLVQQQQYYNDPKVIESEARQQLGYVRPGEHAIMIIGVDDKSKQQPVVHKQPTNQQGFWSEWWHSLFGS